MSAVEQGNGQEIDHRQVALKSVRNSSSRAVPWSAFQSDHQDRLRPGNQPQRDLVVLSFCTVRKTIVSASSVSRPPSAKASPTDLAFRSKVISSKMNPRSGLYQSAASTGVNLTVSGSFKPGRV